MKTPETGTISKSGKLFNSGEFQIKNIFTFIEL